MSILNANLLQYSYINAAVTTDKLIIPIKYPDIKFSSKSLLKRLPILILPQTPLTRYRSIHTLTYDNQ